MKIIIKSICYVTILVSLLACEEISIHTKSLPATDNPPNSLEKVSVGGGITVGFAFTANHRLLSLGSSYSMM